MKYCEIDLVKNDVSNSFVFE